MKNKLNLIVCVDDVHPEANWGLSNDPQIKMMEELYNNLGVKFTLFVPSNYHGKFPISKHRDWVDWFIQHPAFELAAHGHLHMTSKPDKYGECEFIDDIDIRSRISDCVKEWVAVEYLPKSWRNPGWLCSQMLPSVIVRQFPSITHVALHYEHNRGLVWHPLKEIFGHDDIQNTSISVHNENCIMYQSHIFGKWNRNLWNSDNFAQLELSIQTLMQTHSITPITVSEI